MPSLFVVSLFGFAFLVLLFAGALVSSSAPNFGLLRPSFVFLLFLFRVATLIISRRYPLAFHTRSSPWPVFFAVR